MKTHRTDIYYGLQVVARGAGRVRRLSHAFELFYSRRTVLTWVLRRQNWHLVIDDDRIVEIKHYWRNRAMIITFDGDDEIGLRSDVLDDVSERSLLPIVAAETEDSVFRDLRAMRQRHVRRKRR